MASIPPRFSPGTVEKLWDQWSRGHLELIRSSLPEFVAHFRSAFIGGLISGSQIKRSFRPARLTFGDPERIKEHLLEYVVVQPNGCWEWTRGRSSSGYGVVDIDRHQFRASRLVAHFYKGFDLRSSLVICHSCDNPPCINPDHLFPGTHRENILDAVSKGRFGGLKQKKLTVSDVRSIRRLAAIGFHQGTIGAMYDCSQGGISSIVTGKSWKRPQSQIGPVSWTYSRKSYHPQKRSERHGVWQRYKKGCRCKLCGAAMNIRMKLRRLKVTSSFLPVP